MALYWPDQKVALQIDDDPAAAPYEGPDDWTVIHATKAALNNFDSFETLMRKLARAVGETPVDEGGREGRRRLFEALLNRMDSPGAEGQLIVDTATGEVTTWDEQVPEGSFELMGNGLCMSTPEFFYLREARTRSIPQLVQLGYELCGLYSTDRMGRGETYRIYPEPVTSVAELRDYLGGARDLEGYHRAMKALNYVTEGAGSPASAYLSMLLTLPRHMGGYDLWRAKLSTRLVSPLTFERAPTDEGRFEAYDLCWSRQGVALQFVGDSAPNARERRALEAPGLADLYVVCVTSHQMEDAEAFDEAARLLAEHLGTPLPPSTDAFAKARDALRKDLEFPRFDHMREMAEDWHWHEVA